MKYCILTSNQPRHEAFVRFLSKNKKPAFILKEEKKPFQKEKLEKEFLYFNNLEKEVDLKNIESFQVKNGEVNSEFVESLFVKYDVDVCCVFGTSILKRNIIKKEGISFVNIHTGLTQYYRGVDSCFWAIFDNQPEKVGVTIHKVALGIDNGKIIEQSKTDFKATDDLDQIFFKTCEEGFHLLSKNLENIPALIENGHKLSKPNLGKLFNRRDMDKQVVKELNLKYNKTLGNYFENKTLRDSKVRIIKP